jgi:drug/metabolite transporter (DMT)-like permease
MAMSMVYTRRLAAGEFKTHWSVHIFFFCFTNLVINAIWGFVAPQNKPTVRGYDFYLCTVGLSVLLTLQQSSFVKSMKFNKAGAIGTIIYLSIPVGYALDWFIVGQEFHVLDIVGAAIITMTNVTIATLRIKGLIL